MLLTRPPLSTDRSQLLVRLACMKHAASVRPEPGSNSPLSEKFMSFVCIEIQTARLRINLQLSNHLIYMKLTGTFVFSYSIFKVRLKNFPPEYDFPFQTVTSMLPPPKFSVKRFFNLDCWHFSEVLFLTGICFFSGD